MDFDEKRFDRVTHESIRLMVDKLKTKHPIFIDTVEKIKAASDSKLYQNMNLSNFHLPFQKLVFIIANVIVTLTKITDKYILADYYDTEAKATIRNKIVIHNDDRIPKDAIPQKDHQYLLYTDKLDTGWSITFITEKNAQFDDPLRNNAVLADESTTVVFRVCAHVIKYFYPFCVNKEMFVVESQPAVKKKGKIRTRGKRIFSIMHVKKVMKRFKPTGQPGKPLHQGHLRRAHLREYRSSRWTNMQGNCIIVKSTWVGPKTVLSEGKLYRVHTDIY